MNTTGFKEAICLTEEPHKELTGTQLWGLSTDKSDWDYITFDKDIDTWRKIASGFELKENAWNRGFSYVDAKGKKINIIALSIPEFHAWSLATKLMVLIPKKKLEDRAYRIATFKLLLGVAYMHIDVTTSSSTEEEK